MPSSMRTRWCWCCGEPVFCRLNRTAPFWTWYYYIPTSRNSDDCSWERICTHCYVDLVENRANQFETRLTSLYSRLNMFDDINELLTIDGEYLESRCWLNWLQAHEVGTLHVTCALWLSNKKEGIDHLGPPGPTFPDSRDMLEVS